jgi:hypothetical protein
MMPRLVAGVLATMAISSGVVVVCLGQSPLAAPADDRPIDRLLDEYVSETESLDPGTLNDPEKLTRFHRTWLARFLDVIERHPNHKGVPAAKTTAASLAHGVGNLELAERLVVEVAESTVEPAWKAYWLRNAAEFAWARYASAPDVAYAARAQGYIEQALTLLKEPVNPAPFQFGYNAMTERGVLCTLLADIHERAHHDLAAAASVMRDLRLMLFAECPDTLSAPSNQSSVDVEWLVTREAELLTRQGRVDQALSLIEMVRQIPARRMEPSFYADRIAGLADPARGDEFQEIVRRWLLEREPDRWTAMLRVQLAFSYGDQSLEAFKQATIVFETGLPALRRLDAESGVDTRRAGNTQFFLSLYAQHALAVGDRRTARKVLELLRTDHPEAPGRAELERRIQEKASVPGTLGR